jgi:hypothetical protein
MNKEAAEKLIVEFGQACMDLAKNKGSQIATARAFTTQKALLSALIGEAPKASEADLALMDGVASRFPLHAWSIAWWERLRPALVGRVEGEAGT